MTGPQLQTAIRILREQIAVRRNTNDVIRKRFGERITIALTAECNYRDREIEALELILSEYIEPAVNGVDVV